MSDPSTASNTRTDAVSKMPQISEEKNNAVHTYLERSELMIESLHVLAVKYNDLLVWLHTKGSGDTERDMSEEMTFLSNEVQKMKELHSTARLEYGNKYTGVGQGASSSFGRDDAPAYVTSAPSSSAPNQAATRATYNPASSSEVTNPLDRDNSNVEIEALRQRFEELDHRDKELPTILEHRNRRKAELEEAFEITTAVTGPWVAGKAERNKKKTGKKKGRVAMGTENNGEDSEAE